MDQDDIGELTDPRYKYELYLDNYTPIKEQPIPYPPHVEGWLDEQLDSMIKTGRIRPLGPDEEAPMVTALVLAPNAQSGQAFRICQNLIPVNKRTPELQRHITDCRSILSRMGRAKYASLIDLKAGYHNVLFGESAKYATFTTHRGRFRWLRMPFGLSNAPAHFTWVMNDIVHGDRAQGQSAERKLPCKIYLDDSTVTGDDIDQTLADTLTVIVRLAKAGAMISLKKSTVCGIEGKVLGHRWQSGGMFNPEPKGLKALLDIPNDEMGKIPVASIYGLLSFFRPYIADFVPRTEPLRKLLAEAAPPW